MADENATKRIPVTPTAWDEVRDFCSGLSANYSEGILFLLDKVKHPNEDSLTAGRRLRDEFAIAWSNQQKSADEVVRELAQRIEQLPEQQRAVVDDFLRSLSDKS